MAIVLNLNNLKAYQAHIVFRLLLVNFHWRYENSLARSIVFGGIDRLEVDNSNKIMSRDKYVEKTLTLPSELPLFNYNINFEGLRHILEGVNLQTNAHQELISKLQ